LAFLEHVHERNPGEGLLGGVDGLEPQHGTGDALHAAMILFHEIKCYFRDARTGVVMALANGTTYQTTASLFFPAEKGQG
jgi:hypothetical protein